MPGKICGKLPTIFRGMEEGDSHRLLCKSQCGFDLPDMLRGHQCMIPISMIGPRSAAERRVATKNGRSNSGTCIYKALPPSQIANYNQIPTELLEKPIDDMDHILWDLPEYRERSLIQASAASCVDKNRQMLGGLLEGIAAALVANPRVRRCLENLRKPFGRRPDNATAVGSGSDFFVRCPRRLMSSTRRNEEIFCERSWGVEGLKGEGDHHVVTGCGLC